MSFFKLWRRLKRVFPKGMSAQLALALIALVTIPLVLLGASLLLASREAVRETLFRDYEQIAVRSASQIEQMVEEPMSLLASTASMLTILSEDTWNQETVLVELALNHPYFERLSIIGLDQREIASSDMGALRDTGKSDPEWTHILGRDAYMSHVQISQTLSPYIRAGIPLIREGRRVGTLVAVMSLKRLWTLVDGIRIGETGGAYVVDERGILVAHPDKKMILRQDEFAARAIQKMDEASGVVVDNGPRGVHWIKGYAVLPRLGWRIVVRQDAREAFWYLERMQAIVWFLIMAAVITAGSAGVLLAQRVVRPVKRLSQSLLRVSKGNLDEHLKVRRSDEMGKLAVLYNRTVSKLREARDYERLATVGRALTAIIHELKNSLVLVNTYISLLPKRGHERAFLDRMSVVLPRELDAWKNMLQDVAEYSKKVDYALEPICLSVVLDELHALMLPRFEERGLCLRCQTPGELPFILGNRQKLKQALINLILNAIDFSPEGGAVHLSVLRQEIDGSSSDTVQILITDEGPGIPEDLLPKIFDPFFSTKANSLGLGLAISREIVSRHGGRLEAVNGDGRGVTFVLTLPCRSFFETSGRLAESSESIL